MGLGDTWWDGSARRHWGTLRGGGALGVRGHPAPGLPLSCQTVKLHKAGDTPQLQLASSGAGRDGGGGCPPSTTALPIPRAPVGLGRMFVLHALAMPPCSTAQCLLVSSERPLPRARRLPCGVWVPGAGVSDRGGQEAGLVQQFLPARYKGKPNRSVSVPLPEPLPVSAALPTLLPEPRGQPGWQQEGSHQALWAPRPCARFGLT